MTRWFLVALVLSFGTVAAGGNKKTVEAKGAENPKAVATGFTRAMIKGDKKAMLGYCKGSPEELDVIAAIADFAKAVIAFKKAFIKTYGEQAWKDFQDPAKGPKEGNARLNMPSKKDLDSIAKTDFAIENGKTKWMMPNAQQPVDLVLSNGKWFVVSASLLPPGAKPAPFAKMMRSFTKIVAKYQTAIGKKGISAEDIDAELGRDIVKTLLGMTTPTPHRFDVDKLQ